MRNPGWQSHPEKWIVQKNGFSTKMDLPEKSIFQKNGFTRKNGFSRKMDLPEKMNFLEKLVRQTPNFTKFEPLIFQPE
jgi:hypothetical protein